MPDHEPREANLDGSIHVEGDCCVRVVEPCRRCGGPRHVQGAYGALLELCERCPEDAEAWQPAGTYDRKSRAAFVAVTLVGPLPRHIATTADSLERFRTVAFGIEIMRDMIAPQRAAVPTFDASDWLHGVVPECYRPSVLEAIERAFAPHRGEKLTRDGALAIVVEMNREIWATVAPIDPA